MLARAIDAPTSLVDVVLSDVGLLDRAGDRYKGYSLGMKQRLAIAATLLKDPDLLIFDEPTNGLDPAGIREIRGTMRGLAERGKTVLVSSHILAEVEQVADTVSIIARGELIASGTVADLIGAGAAGTVRVGDRRRAPRAAGARCAGLDRADRGAVPAGRRRRRPGQHHRGARGAAAVRRRAGARPRRPRVGLPRADRRARTRDARATTRRREPDPRTTPRRRHEPAAAGRARPVRVAHADPARGRRASSSSAAWRWSTSWQSASPPSQAELGQAQAYYEQALADWEEDGDADGRRLRGGRGGREGDRRGTRTPSTGAATRWSPGWRTGWGRPPSFDADTTGLLVSMSVLFVLAPLLLAGSFVSAEFSTGSIGNWLTFAPRRVRVYLSKVLAAGLAIIPVTAVAVGLVLGGSWLSYRYFDTLDAAAAGTDLSSPGRRRAAHRRPRTGGRRDRCRPGVPGTAHRGGARDRARVARAGRGDPGQPGAEPAAVDAGRRTSRPGSRAGPTTSSPSARRRRWGSRASAPRTSCRRRSGGVPGCPGALVVVLAALLVFRRRDVG